MTSKELRKQVVDRIYEGKSYQMVFEELTVLYPNRERDLARVIADVPSLAQRSRYAMLNVGLIVLLTLAIMFQLVDLVWHVKSNGASGIFNVFRYPILKTILLVGVVLWKPRMYQYTANLGIFYLIIDALMLIWVPFIPVMVIDYVFFGAMTFLGFFLYSKLGGKYQLGTQRHKDALGNITVKQAVKWLN